MTPRILVVDDEPAIRTLIQVQLLNAGYEVFQAGDVDSAMRLVREVSPDLAMVDWMLPGQSGIALVRALRADQTTRDMPIVMMTARCAEQDVVVALESGADDYITKPFKAREMLARVHAVLRRRAPHATASSVAMCGLRIDPDSYEVTAGDLRIELSPTEFRLLHFLMSYPSRVHSRAQLLDKVWSTNSYLMERTVDAHVGRLRSALEASGHHIHIETVRGVGYRFIGVGVGIGVGIGIAAEANS